ncbi:glycosyltransferase family 2 protein [Nesterenkonia lutea]|uniref:Glycosyltransferase involved in cell wall biosynthesis n=1 Tax=Nesterenkonia lutea TaxID=272919 RepID=A0ABR9JE15_9MICC|nr:glycosyltransferase family 2 protein [Nesterenkonia lutea]MBE1523722.1 glycosyltransferase involved in cell wall biosynthesis [Nesterenkonia lutea]
MLGPRSVRSHKARGRVINAARELSVPLVFADLGTDTPRAEQLTLAGRCDHIFVVSEENAERYRSAAPRSININLIPSPISPLNRSPLGSQRMTDPLVTYFQDGGAKLGVDVAESLEWILDGVAGSGAGLLISPGHRPDRPLQIRQWPYVQEWAAFRRAELDRLSDIGVVAHGISGSQTAFNPRAVALQASGTMVLSTYNQGINSYYPQIHVANSAEDVATMLDSLEIKDLRRNQSDGIRQVFNDHHASDVLRSMLERAGVSASWSPDRVLAVVEEQDDTLLAEMAAQTAGAVETVTWREASERHGQYDVLIPVSAEHHYSPTYVADHLAALSYQSAPVVTKHADPIEPGHVHSQAHTGSLALTAWWRPEDSVATGVESMQKRLSETRVYVADGFGHRERIVGRSRRTLHLLGTGDDIDEVSMAIRRTAQNLNLQLTVVVPIYNNGPHLRHKAFASLLRSSAFEEMHVLLVSDGSTDPVTLDTIEDLVDDYPNVSSFHHARGGSGSASRPRNTGLDLAQTPYVTYLDPDNEAIDNGYARLYEQIQEHPRVDFVLGNMSQWAKRRTMLPYAEVLQSLFADHLDAEGNIAVPPRALEALRFRPMGIQTVIARTDWLKSLGLTQPVGAVGQDSYFFQQMLHYATSVRTVDVGVHTYYMVVSNSTVNTLNPNYFKKYLPLDRARAQWLAEVDLLDAYKKERLEPFLVSWLLPKLRRVQEDEWYEAAENLAELLNCYGPYRWTQPTAIDFWDDLRRARSRRVKLREESNQRVRTGHDGKSNAHR